MQDAPTSRSTGLPWTWLSPLLILAVIFIGYGPDPTRLPLVGEETCRARHGVEMAATGDWLIARQQGVEILDRPPLQYWLHAVIHEYISPLDPMTLRVTALVILFATSLVLWHYCRRVFGEAPALLAGLAYPTMGHVFDLGLRVETDSLFTFLLVTAMLWWHAGYVRGGRLIGTWLVPYFVAALATLAKGTQAPVAFFGGVYLFLVFWERDWRSLFGWRQIAGVLAFVGTVAVWQVPFYLETGWEGTKSTWLEPGASRMGGGFVAFLRQLVELPLAIVGAALPWSLLLLAMFLPGFGKGDRAARSSMAFTLVCMFAVFFPVWISPGGHHRYTMPLYPLMAVLVGSVMFFCLREDFTEHVRRFWRDFFRIAGTAMAALGIGFGAFMLAQGPLGIIDESRRIPLHWSVGLVLVLLGVVGGVTLWRTCRSPSPRNNALAMVLLAAYVAVWFNGPIKEALLLRANDVGPGVLEVRESLPDSVTLVSFEPLHHKFVYWYEEDIPILPWPSSAEDVPPEVEYFAFTRLRGTPSTLPFEWEEIADVNMDRTRTEDPENRVIVGRRVVPD